ncbi:M24 family metallopeptidase, partial [Chloroflexota bacterium]
EGPVISRVWSLDYPQTLESGMVIAVESREGERGIGGVRLEEMVVVTDTGNELITTWPAEEIMPAGQLSLG